MPGGKNPNAWNNWYHCVGSTYGTWPRGDPRGFRTFRHRQHIEGDYKNPPPPGVYAPIFEVSKRRMRYPPVLLNLGQRDILCRAIIEQLEEDNVEVVALAVAIHHFHLLARFPLLDMATRQQYHYSLIHDGRDPSPRHLLGQARKHASQVLAEKQLKPASPVWGRRPKCDPLRDRRHQVNATGYIRNHVVEGAVVYCLGAYFYPR